MKIKNMDPDERIEYLVRLFTFVFFAYLVLIGTEYLLGVFGNTLLALKNIYYWIRIIRIIFSGLLAFVVLLYFYYRYK